MRKFTLKEKWYFIKQDIVSYTMSTLLYIALCLITNFSWQSLFYAIFECMVFYLQFWYIRIKFDDTYHSSSWKHCKFWTRTMLCSGVTMLWFLPIKYTLFNALAVAFICCLTLYLVAIETNEKKGLQAELKELKEKLIKTPEQELIDKCHNAKLCKRDTEIAILYYINKWKPKDIWLWLCQHKEYEHIEWDSVHQLLWRIGNKIK